MKIVAVNSVVVSVGCDEAGLWHYRQGSTWSSTTFITAGEAAKYSAFMKSSGIVKVSLAGLTSLLASHNQEKYYTFKNIVDNKLVSVKAVNPSVAEVLALARHKELTLPEYVLVKVTNHRPVLKPKTKRRLRNIICF